MSQQTIQHRPGSVRTHTTLLPLQGKSPATNRMSEVGKHTQRGAYTNPSY
jgi:hypothetical protein